MKKRQRNPKQKNMEQLVTTTINKDKFKRVNHGMLLCGFTLKAKADSTIRDNAYYCHYSKTF